MSTHDPVSWTSHAVSHVGTVRKINEDACLDRPERGLWAVADGMGGHSAGDVASSRIIEALDGLSPAGSLSEMAEKPVSHFKPDWLTPLLESVLLKGKIPAPIDTETSVPKTRA